MKCNKIKQWNVCYETAAALKAPYCQKKKYS